MRFLNILLVLLLLEEYQCYAAQINATHCEYTKIVTVGKKTKINKIIKCCPNYKNGPRKNSCIPKCDRFCENSICTAPNECSCKQGFKKLSPYRCIPHCANCERGRCVGPNICECYSGYQKNETGQCEPFCRDTCINGWCSEPDVCTCNQGYELDKTNQYKCYPNCTNACIQGRCVAPDVCDCHPGYGFKNGSNTECLPICDFCESGNCTGPSKCTCWDNYEEHRIVKGTKTVTICQPKCKMNCINGTCIEVDTCSCFKGYEFLKHSDNICEPVCDHPCDNGVCIEPNVCSCHDGFDNINGQCIPHCDNECVNGFCVHPNQCECNKDYKFVSNSIHTCEAICENACINGTCTKPNICECFEGFKMNEADVCDKMCLPECIFGECINGICMCETGFRLFNQSTNDCRPYCETPCINGTCIGNNTCLCEDLFELNNENVCELICSPPCENGDCMENNRCACQDGYRIDYEKVNHCEPICGVDKESCIKGLCVAPGICKCFNGSELSKSFPFVCVLEEEAAFNNALFSATFSKHFYLILALLVVMLTGITLILLANTRHRKVNYNVDEKEQTFGIIEAHVHYSINKDKEAYA